MKNILFFEDDIQSAKLVKAFLAKKSFNVTHHYSFSDFNQQSQNLLDKLPDAVILDIRLPGASGYEICQTLKDMGLPDYVPIIFMSALMESEDIIKAYQVGGHDYLIKPVNLNQLEIKLSQNINASLSTRQLKEDLTQSNDMALKALTSMSELGEILRFHDECITVTETDELIEKLFELLDSFGLRASIMLHGNHPIYRTSDDRGNELESQTLQLMRGRERIFSWSNRTCFNYSNFTLLITNMPIDKEERYGELKDLLCLLLNGLNPKFDVLRLSIRERKKTALLSQTVESLYEIVEHIAATNKTLANQFEQVILGIEQNIASEIIQFNLMESEERILLDHINKSLRDAQVIFDKSLEAEQHFQAQINVLTNALGSED